MQNEDEVPVIGSESDSSENTDNINAEGSVDTQDEGRQLSSEPEEGETTDAAAQEPPKGPDQYSFETTVGDEHIMVVTKDPMGNIANIDSFPIKDVVRVSFNCITGALLMVLPETFGDIAERQRPVLNKLGKHMGGYTREFGGRIQSFKVTIDDIEQGKKFLQIYLGADFESFIGFEAYQRSQDKINEAIAKKEQEDKDKL